MRVLEDIFDSLIEKRAGSGCQVQRWSVLFGFKGIDSLAGDSRSHDQVRLCPGYFGTQYSQSVFHFTCSCERGTSM